MEPLKVIYDGYEIEIRSGGYDSMPIVNMRKMVSNNPEVDEDFYKKMLNEALKGYQEQLWKNPPMWWENPPMWVNPANPQSSDCDSSHLVTTNTTAEWTNKDHLDSDSTTKTEIMDSLPSVWNENDNVSIKSESYTNMKSQDRTLRIDGVEYKVNKEGVINNDFYSDWE